MRVESWRVSDPVGSRHCETWRRQALFAASKRDTSPGYAPAVAHMSPSFLASSFSPFFPLYSCFLAVLLFLPHLLTLPLSARSCSACIRVLLSPEPFLFSPFLTHLVVFPFYSFLFLSPFIQVLFDWLCLLPILLGWTTPFLARFPMPPSFFLSSFIPGCFLFVVLFGCCPFCSGRNFSRRRARLIKGSTASLPPARTFPFFYFFVGGRLWLRRR